MDGLNYVLSLGIDLDRVQSMLADGLTMQEIVDAVQRMQSRGEAVDNIADTVKPNDYSDAGNAEVFIARNRGRMVYTDSRGWLIWDGKRWAADDHKAHQIAVQLSGEMLADAQAEYQAALFNQAAVKAAEAANEEPNPEATERTANEVKKAKAYLSHALQFRNERRIKAMMELAKHELAVDPAILDANPMELNTPKGIVDLPTGQIRPHDAQAHCTYMTAVGPGTAGMEMWIDFLNTITEGDGSLMGFLQMVAGMALYGKVFEERLIMAYGGGRNGKSTFFNALGAVLGDYCGVIDIETITTSRDNKGPDLIELRGKRLVLAGELEEGRRLSVSTVKKICSTDRITAAAKFRQPETFTPSHTLILHSNHLPRVGSSDDGTWRRLLPVEFKARIPDGTGVSNYRDSKSYPQNKKLLDDKRNAQVDVLRREAQEQLFKIVDDMRQTYEAKPSKAPTAEQLAILQALKMRDSVSEDELKQALNAVKGCPLAERVVGELAAKHHHILGMERELSGDTVRRSLDSLRLNGERLISKLERPGEDRRAAVNRGDYTMFQLDQEPKDEADAMRIFGQVTDYAQFSQAVNS